MLFVTGTDTGVGKTHTATVLLQQMQRLGFQAGAYKPVCSGAETETSPADGQTTRYFWSDVRRLQQACSLPAASTDICPQLFLAPLAPNVAAAAEGRTVDDDLLSRGLDVWKNRAELMLIEGAGGLCCPLSDKSTVFDLVRRLNCPVIDVAGNRLGVISHTRMTVELLLLSGCHVAGIILNEISPPAAAAEDISKFSNARQLQTWLPHIPLLQLGWNGQQLESADPQQSADAWLRQTATAASRRWQSHTSTPAAQHP
jgi:dethiobiotin synthetase